MRPRCCVQCSFEIGDDALNGRSGQTRRPPFAPVDEIGLGQIVQGDVGDRIGEDVTGHAAAGIALFAVLRLFASATHRDVSVDHLADGQWATIHGRSVVCTPRGNPVSCCLSCLFEIEDGDAIRRKRVVCFADLLLAVAAVAEIFARHPVAALLQAPVADGTARGQISPVSFLPRL